MNRRRRIFANPRILILLGAALAVLSQFVLRLWDLQIVHGAEYRNRATNNRLREVTIAAPRGVIYDRNGQPLVYNAPNYEVQIIPAYLPDNETDELAVYERLSKLLGMPVEASPVMSDVVSMGRGAVSVLDGMKYLYDRMDATLQARRCCIKSIVDEVRLADLAYADVKRLELAIALAGAPRLLLMDEPTACMAAAERAALMDLVTAIAAQSGLTVLFTEHSMEVVFGYARRLLVMLRGRLIADGEPDAVRAMPTVQAAYFGEA